MMDKINQSKLFLLEELVKRNFSAKYKDSVLGIIWTVLKPLLVMILLTIIFSTIFGKNIENYPVYLLSGRVMYDLFRTGVSSSINAIRGSKNILQKNVAPIHIFVLSRLISELINFAITVVLLVVIMFVTRAPFPLETMPLAIIPVISLFIMLIGLGLMLSILSVYYTDIQHLWGVMSVMFMYAGAIFYPMEMIPQPYKSYMMLNPVWWSIDQFRHFFIWGKIPDPLNILNLLLLSVIIFILGIIIYIKYEKEVIIQL